MGGILVGGLRHLSGGFGDTRRARAAPAGDGRLSVVDESRLADSILGRAHSQGPAVGTLVSDMQQVHRVSTRYNFLAHVIHLCR